MKKVKMTLAVMLLCAMGYAGYSANNYFTTPAEKLMKANVQALTRNESGGGNNKYVCYYAYRIADNYTIIDCSACRYVHGIGEEEKGVCNSIE